MRKVLFVLAAYDSESQHLGNASSSRDFTGSCKAAESFLRLTPTAASVDVIAWRPGVDWSKVQPSEVVHRDQEK
jgi:hypothetical protein